jgi:hypothetical protein
MISVPKSGLVGRARVLFGTGGEAESRHWKLMVLESAAIPRGQGKVYVGSK